MRRRLAGLCIGVAAAFAVAAPSPAVGQDAAPVVDQGSAPDAARLAARAETAAIIFLVRHAETEPDGTRDPSLSTAGTARAARLAGVLADAGLDAVYTTDYIRTRGTAAGVAERLGLEPTVYDPARLVTFARALVGRGGRVLVVGHSNTTPDLVAALGGDPGPAIAEDEHDRLYILFLDDDDVRTVRLRY